MADIEKLRARGAPEVLVYLSPTLALFLLSYLSSPIFQSYIASFLLHVDMISFRAFLLSTSFLNIHMPTLMIPTDRN